MIEFDTLEAEIWYLEMKKKPERLLSLDGIPYQMVHMKNVDVEEYLSLYKEVGKGLTWFARLMMTPAEVLEIINHQETYLYFLMDKNNKACGILEMQCHNKEMEIVYFGIIESEYGKGLGKKLMSFAIELAWSRDITRFWLHTCSFDHPRALLFYQENGFEIYKQDKVFEKIPKGYIPFFYNKY